MASQGDVVDVDIEIYLHKGECVSKSHHVQKLNRGHFIPGVVYSTIGMKEGGYREVKISPHLAYGEKGVEGIVPENAVLHCKIWLRKVNA